MIRRWRALSSSLFPPSCVLCGSCVEAERAPICPGCWSRLPRTIPPVCPRCGAPGPRFLEGMVACGECVGWPRGLPAARAPFLMRDGAARLVRALKYSGWTDLARRMGGAMAPSARTLAGSATRLAAVPLSPARRRRRGFNQAELLARSLGAELSWPVVGALERSTRGRRQARLSGASRRENVRGLFRATPAPPAGGPGSAPTGSSGVPVLVVDDVVTTGSTAAACVDALSREGWRPLGVVAFARAVSLPHREGGTVG